MVSRENIVVVSAIPQQPCGYYNTATEAEVSNDDNDRNNLHDDGDDVAAPKVRAKTRDTANSVASAPILNVMHEGIRSLLELDLPAHGVTTPSTLLSLSLHSNRVTSLEGLASMTVS